jgi:HNH endonuclease/AP2 domain
MKHKPLPSQERLQELFDYSIVTGELRWKQYKNGFIEAGSVVAPHSFNNRGYLTVEIEAKRYLQHRIIWMLVTGVDPGRLQIDHRNGDRSNNAWHNLRVSTGSQNRANSLHRPGSATGLKGVHRVTGSTTKFRAAIKFQGKQLHLGTFQTPEEAHAAYCKAAHELHGEYARTQ